MNKQLIANAALLAVLAVSAASPANAGGKEKCYGIAMAAQNDSVIYKAPTPAQVNPQSITTKASGNW